MMRNRQRGICCRCVSVRPSQAGIVSKRQDESRRFLAWMLHSTCPALYFMEIWVYPK